MANISDILRELECIQSEFSYCCQSCQPLNLERYVPKSTGKDRGHFAKARYEFRQADLMIIKASMYLKRGITYSVEFSNQIIN